jgi:HAAS domain-containing protein
MPEGSAEMTLLDRYLEAVRNRLPRNQRDDIAAELRDVLLSQIEAEEASRGRPLTDDEVAEMLRRFGRPMTVAARYGASNYLIGPATYPAYLASLKVLAWIWGPIALLSVLLSVATADDPLRQAASKLLLFTVIGLANFAIITLVFARIERAASFCTSADNWDPRSLPSPQQPEPTPQSHVIASLVLMTFYLLLWIGVLPIDSWIARLNTVVGGTPLPYGFAPVWSMVSPLIVALMLTSIVRDIVALIRPDWLTLRGYTGLALHVGGLLVLIRLVRADAVFVVTDPSGIGAAHIGHFNTLFFMVLFAAASGAFISTLVAFRHVMKRRTSFA